MPITGYTVRTMGDDSKSYDCTCCGNSSIDLDAARAHHAVHVAGPELLAALKKAQLQLTLLGLQMEGPTGAEIAAAVAKAEPYHL